MNAIPGAKPVPTFAELLGVHFTSAFEPPDLAAGLFIPMKPDGMVQTAS